MCNEHWSPLGNGQSNVALEIPQQESKAKITSDTDQAVNALNGRIVAWSFIGV